MSHSSVGHCTEEAAWDGKERITSQSKKYSLATRVAWPQAKGPSVVLSGASPCGSMPETPSVHLSLCLRLIPDAGVSIIY